jgi:hypothetical protein
LELFLSSVVEEAHKVTAQRNAKRLEPHHLFALVYFRQAGQFADILVYSHRKHAILNTPLLDFLKELVEAVPDPSNGGTVDETEAVPKKRTRGKGKAKAKSDPEVKEEDEEDSDEG